jgi:adenylate cyclase
MGADDKRIPYLLAMTIWLAAFALSAGELGERLESPLLDWNLRQLAARSNPDPDIVVLDIDEPTLAALAPEYGRYPWSRAVYGALIDGLARQRPRAIVFDILLVDPHREHAADDLYLIRAAQAASNVFFPLVRLPGGAAADADGVALAQVPGLERGPRAEEQARAALLLPLPGLAATGRIGAINAEPDADGVLRRYPLFHPAYGWRIPSLPARVAQELGYALPAADTLGLRWHGPARSYRTISLHEVLFDFERHTPVRARDEFTGKIVVVGASAPGLADLKHTPMATGFPGTEIIVTAIDNLKHGERLQFAPRWSGPLLTALALAVLLAAGGLGLFGLGAVTLGLSAGLGAGAFVAVSNWHYAVPVVVPLVLGGWIFYLLTALRAWLLERRDRQRVTQLFGRFLDPRVVADLVARRGADIATGGERREITVLFSDIRGFTTLSEQRPAQEVVELLNRYFRLQVEVIFRHQGTLDKYIGDAIMAFWGAPTDQPDHAQRALAAAREMEQRLLRFQRELGPAGKDFEVGIGLCSGEAVVGFIGSPEHRQDYTVIGDAVNTAARIESATKGRARVLVAASTRDAAGPAYEFRDHGAVALKGKEAKVHLYEPLFGGNTHGDSTLVDSTLTGRRGPRGAAGRRRAGKRNRQYAR